MIPTIKIAQLRMGIVCLKKDMGIVFLRDRDTAPFLWIECDRWHGLGTAANAPTLLGSAT